MIPEFPKNNRRVVAVVCTLMVAAFLFMGCSPQEPAAQPTQGLTQEQPVEETPEAGSPVPTNTLVAEVPSTPTATMPAEVAGAPVAPFTIPALNPAPNPAAIEFIIDASEGMNDLVDGQIKMAVAREVLTKVLQGAPDNIQVGVRVYGQQVGSDPANQNSGCKDFEQVAPVVPIDRANLPVKVQTLKAGGWSPLALTLLSSLTDFPQNANNAVIVISSRGDNCGGDPVRSAQTLKESREAVKVHIIGFDVQDPTGRDTLVNIAQQGGGTYTDVSNSQELADAIVNAITAIQTTPVQVAQAPTSTPTPVPVAVSNPVAVQASGGATPTPIHIWETPPAAGLNCRAVILNNANVRSGPDRAFPIVKVIPKGTEVTIVGRNWYTNWLAFYVQTDQLGWVATYLLDIDVKQCNPPQLKEPAVPTEKPTKPYP